MSLFIAVAPFTEFQDFNWVAVGLGQPEYDHTSPTLEVVDKEVALA